VIALFQSIQMLCPTAIVVLLITGLVQPWMIIVLSVVVGITDALSMPSFGFACKTPATRIIEKAPHQPMPPVRRAAQSSAYRVRFHCTVTEREFGRSDTSWDSCTGRRAPF
jgi:hypothetical protein